LSENFPNSSKNKIRKMLTGGRVNVNGKVQHKAKTEINKSDIVEILDISISKENTPPPVKKQTKINIIYEDEFILVVDKPAGLLSIATNKLETDTLHSKCVDYVKTSDPKNWCFIVHRLDKETSGVMVLAHDKDSKEYLQEQFANREVYRIYHALVEGNPGKLNGTEKQWLVEDKNLHVKKVKPSFRGAKEAITHWEVIRENEETSLIKIMIETGRRHQIRMAMKSLKTPVVGDPIHDAETNPYGRICLHASSLEFLHPDTDEPLHFESRIPFKINT
jgi:23S rRNA pseudouridine1911/1915/1917 synthase